MAPHLPAFLPADVPTKARETASGKRNKDLPKDFDLKRDCKLQQLWQYDCRTRRADEDAARRLEGIECWPVQRLFRRCKNGMMVETTRWEGERQDVRADMPPLADAEQAKPS